MTEKLVFEFVTLFVVLEPFGMLAVFLAVTAGLDAGQRRKAAALAILYAFAILVFFVVVGELLLIEMGIPLLAFQVAGGLLLLLYGIEMSLGAHAPGTGPKAASHSDASSSINSLAVYPLAIPSIAGPGAMLTVVLLTDNREHAIVDQLITTAVLGSTLFLFLLILLAASPIMRVIGQGGANVLRRVMGVLLSAIATNMILGAFQDWLGLPPL
jgi:multiple antibiotic resistance protein